MEKNTQQKALEQNLHYYCDLFGFDISLLQIDYDKLKVCYKNATIIMIHLFENENEIQSNCANVLFALTSMYIKGLI